MKLPKDVVLYFPPQLIGPAEGARCGRCIMFIIGGRCTSVMGNINAEKGVCGLYVNGKPQPYGKSGDIPQQIASYTERGPTHCGSCKYYGGGTKHEGPCGKVVGTVAFHGCCNYWEPR